MNKKPIDAMQRKLIHIAKAQLRIADADYRALLVQFTPTSWDMPADKPSCVHMTYEEAHNLLQHFKSLGFKIVSKTGRRSRKASAANVTDIVSDQQLGKIEHLRLDIAWRVHDGFYRWLSKYLKIDCEGKSLRQIIQTTKRAAAVTEALKSMLARQEGASRQQATGNSKGEKYATKY